MKYHEKVHNYIEIKYIYAAYIIISRNRFVTNADITTLVATKGAIMFDFMAHILKKISSIIY